MVRLMICLSALLLGGGADLLSARGRELVAGSYNIRCDTPVDGDNAWPYRKERVEALIRFYGFDVLGVQEAKPSQMSDLRAMPGFASVGVGRDGGDRGEYSAIFYRTDRLRVLDSGTFWLSETPDTVSKGWDAALNRICTWAKMKDRRTGRVFYFFNTHFDHVGREARLRSAELLAGRIRAVAGDQISGALHGRFQRSCRERTGRRDEDRTARCPRGVADACVRTFVQLCRIPRSGSREAQEPYADRLFVRKRPRAGTDLRLAVRLGREESSLGPFPAARRDRIRLRKKSGRFRQASVAKCEDCLRNA